MLYATTNRVCLPASPYAVARHACPVVNPNPQRTQPPHLSRRKLLEAAGFSFVLSLRADGVSVGSALAGTITAPAGLLADVPMRRLQLPAGAVGRDYILVQLTVAGKGPYDFMVDSGLTAELITPHLKQVLGLASSNQRLAQGLGAGGSVSGSELLTLREAALCCGDFAHGADLPLPPLTAVVTDFPQEHLDPEHDPVEGMLGQELLSLYDTDFDFAPGRFRFWQPGAGLKEAAAQGLVEVPAAVLNETGLLGIRVTVPGAASPQPFVGIVDCGASFSALNWKAATLAGLPKKGDPFYNDKPKMFALGVDGKPLQLPTTQVPLTFLGDAYKDDAGKLAFKAPPTAWKPWQPVMAAVGDLPVFSQLLGDGVKPYDGPAALIGLDVLSQRRVIIGSGEGQQGRRRQLFVSAA